MQTSSADKLVPLQIHIEDLHFSVPVSKKKHLFKKNDEYRFTSFSSLIPLAINHNTKKSLKELQLPSIQVLSSPSLDLLEVSFLFNVTIANLILAGKTTLLNVLAGRAAGKIDGKILMNGHPLHEAKQLLKYSSYIMQDDVLLANQSVKEVITFSANMKLDKEFTEVNSKIYLFSHIFLATKTRENRINYQRTQLNRMSKHSRRLGWTLSVRTVTFYRAITSSAASLAANEKEPVLESILSTILHFFMSMNLLAASTATPPNKSCKCYED